MRPPASPTLSDEATHRTHSYVSRFNRANRTRQGVHLALLRMAGEMQACLPSRGTPSSGGGGGPGGRELTRDSGVADVQRQHLRVAAAAFLMKRHLFRYRGTVSAAFVLGGVDAVGEHLYEVGGVAVGLYSMAFG